MSTPETYECDFCGIEYTDDEYEPFCSERCLNSYLIHYVGYDEETVYGE